MSQHRDPNSIVTFNTDALVGTPGEPATARLPLRIGTFLCPHCSKTHIYICLGEGDGPNEAMEINFTMDAENAEKFADEVLNPNPLSTEWVTKVKRGNF